MILLIIAFFILCLCVLAMDILASRKLTVRTEVRTNVKGDGGEVCLVTVKNPGKLPALGARLVMKVENTYTGEKIKKSFRVNSLPGRESTVPMEIETEHCGKISCTVEKNPPCNFTVNPEMFPVEVDFSLHESDVYDCENYSQNRKGKDYSETFQIRDYVPGDNIRHIHWKLSGKTDDLVVKDASLPLDRTMTVFMDKTIKKGAITPDESEALASATVSICRSLTENELEYTLVWNKVENDECIFREINTEEDLISAIPQLLTGKPGTGTKRCCDLYGQIKGACTSTHVINISCGSSAEGCPALSECRVTEIDAGRNNYEELYRYINLQ